MQKLQRFKEINLKINPNLSENVPYLRKYNLNLLIINKYDMKVFLY